jgi:uncharacterized protein
MKLLVALSFFFALTAHAEFKVPVLTGPVMDMAGFLDRSDQRELTRLLYDYNQQGKAQIQVLILPDLQGEPIESASIKITDAWKLGDKKKDNGILFLIAAQERRMRIEVGQGLEGTLPDITAKQIIADTVTPLFRAGRISDGIVVGVQEIIRNVDKEYAEQKLPERKQPQDDDGGDVILIVILFVVILLLNRVFRGGGGGGFFLGGGGFGGGGFGGGGFGGGGGGWSGGGGGFSGGGASGSW